MIPIYASTLPQSAEASPRASLDLYSSTPWTTVRTVDPMRAPARRSRRHPHWHHFWRLPPILPPILPSPHRPRSSIARRGLFVSSTAGAKASANPHIYILWRISTRRHMSLSLPAHPPPPPNRLPCSGRELSAHRRLLWECCGQHARVWFDEQRRPLSADAVRRGARFFHEIRFEGGVPRPFEHPGGPDLYMGRLLLTSPYEWSLLWRVSGPRKLGELQMRYTRERTT